MTQDRFLVSPVALTEAGELGLQQVRWGGLYLYWSGPSTHVAEDGERLALVSGQVDEVRVGSIGAVAETHDPAALLLQVWADQGPGAVDRLVGPWAGLVLTARELHVLRDITGVGRVFVSALRGGPVVGSDLSRVSSLSGNGSRASPHFIAHYVNNSFPPAEVTAFAGVQAVVPGGCASWTGDRWSQARCSWWAPDAFLRDADEGVRRVRQRLLAALRDRTRGAHRAGVALSGGLDSSILLALLALDRRTSVHALAIPFYSARGDERQLQAAFAARAGAELHWVSVAGQSPIKGRGSTLLHGRQWPPFAGNWFFQESLAEAAVDLGLDVLLDGEDADSTFSGPRVFMPDLLISGRWSTWWRQAGKFRAAGRSRRSSFRYSVTSLLPPVLDHRVSGEPRAARPSPLLSVGLRREVDLDAYLQRQRVVRLWAPGRRFAATRQLVVNADRMSTVGLEMTHVATGRRLRTGHPFQDRRVIEAALPLAWHLLADGPEEKVLLRRLWRDLYPDQSLPVPRKAVLDEYYAASAFGQDKESIVEGLEACQRRPELFDPVAVQALQAAFLRREEYWTPTRMGVLGLWLDSLDALHAA